MRSVSRRLSAVTVLAAALLLAPLPMQGQEGPAETIRSDRPGLGDGAWVLSDGVWQAEVGGSLVDDGADEFLQGNALLRLGLSGVELRVFVPSLLLARSDEALALSDAGVGVKLPLSRGGGWDWSLSGAATLPTSTLDGAPDEVGGAAGLIGETSLGQGVGLTLNAGYSFLFDAAGDGTFSLLATPSFDLGDGLGAYGGYAGYFGDGEDGDAHFLEGGLTKVTDADTQWDVNAGWDVENDTFFLGVGLAKRWR